MTDLPSILDAVKALAVERMAQLHELPTIAAPQDLQQAVAKLPKTLSQSGAGLQGTWKVLSEGVAPALAPGHAGSRYFGFVTGGVLPEALIGDWLVTLFDNNVQVHLPAETLSTYIERLAIRMTLELLGLPTARWTGTVTTGATASNVLGLACAREAVLRARGWSAAEDGLAGAPRVNVFVAQPHASVRKAAALVGIGRANVVDVGKASAATATVHERCRALDFDLDALEQRLQDAASKKEASIIVAGFGEVNTGALCYQLPQLRKLSDQYGAWLHVDAAFSAFVCLLDEFSWASGALALADSITSDAHKQLNVPYDAGLFFVRTRSEGADADSELHDVCGPGAGGAAAYLAAPSSGGIDEDVARQPSPLFMNIENSRRFRALPLYAGLMCQGRDGYTALVERNVRFARSVEAWMRSSASRQCYEVLTPPHGSASLLDGQPAWQTTTIVLFRAGPACPVAAYRDPKDGHLALTGAIKATRRMYVTSTTFNGTNGVRLAVSNWSTDESDLAVVQDVLLEVMNPMP